MHVTRRQISEQKRKIYKLSNLMPGQKKQIGATVIIALSNSYITGEYLISTMG